MKSLIAKALPVSVINTYRRLRIRSWARGLSRRELFSRIYARGAWGQAGEPGDFFSGSGSGSEAAAAYIRYVNGYLAKHGIDTIIDIGCGDFRVASRLDLTSRRYIGSDIVPELVARNEARFGAHNIRFLSLDAVAEDPPEGDLALLRQVLQHLNNHDVEAVLRRLKKFPHVIIADELPVHRVVEKNRDVIWGGTRLEAGSGLFLEAPPFNCRIDVLFEHLLDSERRLRCIRLAD